MTQILTALSEISSRYDVLFCDLWGCLHNGQTVFPDAVAALQTFRAGGGTVILVTNSPRPRSSVAAQLIGLGAPDDCYDDIASSGDAAQDALAAGMVGRKVFHIGPERDLVFFHDATGAPIDVERVPLDQAEGVVCTGLFDDRSESPADYEITLRQARLRDLPLLCANPDVIVDVGDKRIFCAGAIAEAYTAIGGTSLYFGKPHAPIYTLARARAETLRGGVVADQHILCIGDGIATDVRGGIAEGLDVLFVTGGLAAEQTATAAWPSGAPDAEKLAAFLATAGESPLAAIGYLR